MQEPKANVDLMDPLAVSDLDEIVAKGKSLQDKALKKYELLEKRMKAMDGINIPRNLDAIELSLVLGLVIPHKFKAQPSTNTMAPSAQPHILQCIVERCRRT